MPRASWSPYLMTPQDTTITDPQQKHTYRIYNVIAQYGYLLNDVFAIAKTEVKCVTAKFFRVGSISSFVRSKESWKNFLRIRYICNKKSSKWLFSLLSRMKKR